MTLFLEGAQPQVTRAGECYWMPPDRAMSGANTGPTAAMLLDTFVVPQGSLFGAWSKPARRTFANSIGIALDLRDRGAAGALLRCACRSTRKTTIS